jgi:hypothetical protein
MRCKYQKTLCMRLAVVAHACNPSYMGGTDREDDGSRLFQTKKNYQNSTLTKKNLSMVVCAYNHSYVRGVSRSKWEGCSPEWPCLRNH